MNFYSCQSSEVEGGCLTKSLRVSWPGNQALRQKPFSSTAGMQFRVGVRMNKAHCFLTSTPFLQLLAETAWTSQDP